MHIVYKYDSKAKESSNSSSDSLPPKKTKYNNSIDNNLISDLDISPLSSLSSSSPNLKAEKKKKKKKKK